MQQMTDHLKAMIEMSESPGEGELDRAARLNELRIKIAKSRLWVDKESDLSETQKAAFRVWLQAGERCLQTFDA